MVCSLSATSPLFNISDGWSIGFFLCSRYDFRPSLPIIGFTCCVTWQVLKRFSSASWRYFVIWWLHQFSKSYSVTYIITV